MPENMLPLILSSSLVDVSQVLVDSISGEVFPLQRLLRTKASRSALRYLIIRNVNDKTYLVLFSALRLITSAASTFRSLRSIGQ